MRAFFCSLFIFSAEKVGLVDSSFTRCDGLSWRLSSGSSVPLSLKVKRNSLVLMRLGLGKNRKVCFETLYSADNMVREENRSGSAGDAWVWKRFLLPCTALLFGQDNRTINRSHIWISRRGCRVGRMIGSNQGPDQQEVAAFVTMKCPDCSW